MINNKSISLLLSILGFLFFLGKPSMISVADESVIMVTDQGIPVTVTVTIPEGASGTTTIEFTLLLDFLSSVSISGTNVVNASTIVEVSTVDTDNIDVFAQVNTEKIDTKAATISNGSATVKDTPVAEKYPFTTARNVNLRGGPGTNYPVVGGLQAGDSLQVEYRDSSGDWFQIESKDGYSAWLAAFLLVDPPSSDRVPIADNIPPPPEPSIPPPKPAPSSASTVSAPRLNVNFINPHYNCNRGDGLNDFYRYFQADFFIENTSSQTIEAKWRPTRWIIVGGDQRREETQMFEWTNRRTGFYEQPDILPGGSEGWTYVAPRVELWEWVQAVEWEYQGQTYRQEFVNNALNRSAWNYIGCSH